MKCPKCGKEMTQREMNGIMYHVCEDCKIRQTTEIPSSKPSISQNQSPQKSHKKKLIILASCLGAFVVIITGIFIYAKLLSKSGYYEDSAGNNVYENEQEKVIFLKQLPASMEYNGNFIDFISLNIYQDESASGYGYNIYATLEVDVSSLSDDDIYWLKKSYENASPLDRELTTDVYVDDEKNSLDFSSLSKGNVYIDGSKWIFCFYDTEEYKYDFTNAEFTSFITIQQEEKYKGDNGEFNRKYKYSYKVSGGNVKSASEMPTEIVNVMIESMDNMMEILQ